MAESPLTEEKRVDLDDFFPFVGEYGKYQKLLTWLIVLPACIPCGLQGFNQLFMADDATHWCRLPEFLVQNTNFTVDQLKALTLPRDSQNEMSSCLIKDVDWPSLHFFKRRLRKQDWDEPFVATLSISTEGENQVDDGDGNGTLTSKLSSKVTTRGGLEDESASWSSSVEVVEEEEESVGEGDYEDLMDELETVEPSLIPVILCPNGWDYADSVTTTKLHTSIVVDFDLVCGKEIYPTIALFLVNFAGLCGVFIFGTLTDLIGRKASFFVCLTFEMIGGIGCVFAEDFWTWVAFRIFVGLTVPAIYQIPFIICLELVGQNFRGFLTVMTCLFYVFGMMLLPLIAFLESDWRFLSIWTTAPFLLYYIYYWFLPESPRWLLSRNRTKEALAILEKLARVNGTVLPQHLVERIILQSADREKESVESRRGLKDLFRTPNLRLKTILLTFCWFTNATVYVGLSFYGPSLGENAYLSFFLGSAIEIPGYLLCWLVMDRLGRRWPLCLCMIIGGIFDIATVLLPSDSSILLMTFYLIAKLGISASYLMVYPFGGELYPTEVRGVGLGFSAYVGGIGICCIPLINYLGRAHLLMPLIVMGVVSVLGGIVSLRLPETLNAALPTTIEEGEEFGKDFNWSDCIRCGPTPSAESTTPSSSIVFEDGNGFPLTTTRDQNTTTSRPYHSAVENIRMTRMKAIERNNTIIDEGSPCNEEASGGVTISEMSPLRATKSVDGGTLRRGPSSKRLVRQGSTLEAPTDSKSGAIMITPWW